MVTDLASICMKEGSSMAMFLSGKTTTLNAIQQAILQSNIIKAVQTGFATIAEIKMNDLFELNIRFVAMEWEVHQIGDQDFKNKDLINTTLTGLMPNKRSSI